MKTLLLLTLLAGTSAPVYVVPANIQCGLPPLPPLGCRLGPCVCDAYGNCHWQFYCN